MGDVVTAFHDEGACNPVRDEEEAAARALAGRATDAELAALDRTEREAAGTFDLHSYDPVHDGPRRQRIEGDAIWKAARDTVEEGLDCHGTEEPYGGGYSQPPAYGSYTLADVAVDALVRRGWALTPPPEETNQ